MKSSKRIPPWALILILLLLANMGWMWWNWSRHSELVAAIKRFKIEVLKTNEMSGVGIFERSTGKPLWAEWDFNGHGKPDQENYFFQGRNVFDVTLSSNHPPVFSVYFYGPGKSSTWWLNSKGAGTFTDRIFYDTNGDLSRREVWFDQAWFAIDRRSEKNGILKGEYGLGGRFKTKAGAQRAVDQAVHLYNTRRPHTALGYRTPQAAHALAA
ncbi:MAG: putative transposase OrfB [Pedosphaera sp.]|nr:putative transposase OrfB [Pedosphaera sp.]